MAIQPLTPLPVPPLATDSEAIFNSKADATLLAEKQLVDQMNASTIPGINQAVTDATAAKNAAAGSATAAAQSASDANTAKAAAQKAVTDSAVAGAAQVALAAAEVVKAQQQVTLAQQQVQAATDAGAAQVTLASVEVTKAQAEVVKAKAQADASAASATAAGAAAGLPADRVPYTTLQIDAAGNVAWRPGLPDPSDSYGKALVAGKDGWAASDTRSVGEVVYTAAALSLSPLREVGTFVPSDTGYTNIAFGNGRFVSVRQGGGKAAWSADGVTWTEVAVPLSGTFRALSFGAGLFVLAQADQHKVYTSADGLTWISRDLPTGSGSLSLLNIVYTGSYFVLCSSNTYSGFFTSVDGVTWSRQEFSSSSSINALTSLGAQGFLMFTSGSAIKYSSPTATPVTVPISYFVISAACNPADGTIVAGHGSSSITMANKFLVSKDFGSTWTLKDAPALGYWNRVAFLNGVFLAAVGTSPVRLLYSPDGVTWSAITLSSNASNTQTTSVASIAYGAGKFITASFRGSYIAKKGAAEYVIGSAVYLKSSYPELAAMLGSLPSDYGVTVRTMAASAIYTDMAYGNGVFVALTTATTYCTSTNGINWTSRTMPVNTYWRGITFANGVFVAICYNGVYTSTDGVTWTSRNTETGNWTGVAYGNGIWLITSATGSTTGGTNAKTLTSSDNGVTWAVRTPAAFTSGATKLAFGAGVFVMAVYNPNPARLFYSSDGETWSQAQVPTGSTNLTSVAYGNGMFIAVSGSSDYYLTSTDGINWVERQFSTGSSQPTLVLFVNGMFVCFFAGSVVITSTDGINWTSRPLKQSIAWQAAAFGAGVLAVAAGGSSSSTIAMTLFNWNYDLNTQFATPALDAPQGLTGYIKARAA
ncbi:sialidase family protein [Pseudomonas sp. DTU_2021_1001937_2_SI_NGA_ILE_001]|uniref:sialidase family protein n=1 Tax=Pseudomonas sp. DTU_2021_1001937_2_SI_NGA_ILE_001 TaxID=3077589 RepID=UPI0028FC2312|nr:sialidase family protein [Pseudomonas sp. DTU_2021_1001937_2_SI_NGA_ILE_001]WNW10135.1 sialidase family protein [Pseudomonas sp. DTU_2021_1001937_2_SI_NGA_ILE_001]